jgi:hypothetical protein
MREKEMSKVKGKLRQNKYLGCQSWNSVNFQKAKCVRRWYSTQRPFFGSAVAAENRLIVGRIPTRQFASQFAT